MKLDGRINTRAWRVLRNRVIREEPTCRLKLDVCTGLSETADHIVPRSQAPRLTYVRSNLRGVCHACNRKRGDNPTTPPALPPAWVAIFGEDPRGFYGRQPPQLK
jgi:5-methylcytosine-specific restriction endonuclease McrA